MNRRGFLGTILAGCVAPYVMSGGVASGVLMPVRRIWTSSSLSFFDASGLLLAQGYYESDDLNTPFYTAVQRSGTVATSVLNHPKLGVRALDLRFASSCFMTGAVLYVMPPRVA